MNQLNFGEVADLIARNDWTPDVAERVAFRLLAAFHEIGNLKDELEAQARVTARMLREAGMTPESDQQDAKGIFGRGLIEELMEEMGRAQEAPRTPEKAQEASGDIIHDAASRFAKSLLEPLKEGELTFDLMQRAYDACSEVCQPPVTWTLYRSAEDYWAAKRREADSKPKA